MRNSYGSLVGKQDGKRSLERASCRFENNVKIYFNEAIGRVCTGFI
jgi:hypothetical protein